MRGVCFGLFVKDARGQGKRVPLMEGNCPSLQGALALAMPSSCPQHGPQGLL